MKNNYGGITSYDRLYRLFCSIKQRCYNPKHKGYKYYGGKGIKICDEWLYNFLNFLDLLRQFSTKPLWYNLVIKNKEIQYEEAILYSGLQDR